MPPKIGRLPIYGEELTGLENVKKYIKMRISVLKIVI